MHYLYRGLVSAVLALAFVAPSMGRESDFPVPDTVSPQLQAMIGAGIPRGWDKPPRTTEEWKAWIAAAAEKQKAALPALREKLGVTMTHTVMAGVPVFVFEPRDFTDDGRLLLNLHGGGYVLGPGEAGTQEAILMAGIGKFRVVYADYRMAPDFPYPAAIDDAMAVYRELLKTTPAKNIGVFGTSTGGAMTLILALRAKAEGLPLPGALASGTPWAQMNKKGDSYFTNEGVDNVLVSYDGWLAGAASLYAGGHDMEAPYLSPVNGDVHGFPPTLLTSGTRDLFLSNTVRMHLKLREAGVPADLIVFEGLSHAQYHMDENMPEGRFHFEELGRFFRRNLAERQS
ncbi:alpha/beta hydrolase [uncultured Mailhella sp.]|uniref:alpha/beta hydrolase n=1 Tax=uncultured Mailhella sp. TaxID=1981031 RepID=UPI0025DF9C02|nr:alpha/beta hydrolase [uncultured Mailhella sp.]